MTPAAASALVYVAGAWLLQILLFADFVAEVRAARRPARRRVDLLDWSDQL